MKVQAMTQPLGIDEQKPSFSWHMTDERIGARQIAYQLIVAEDADFSRIVWDSMRIASSESVGIIYGGAPLKARTRYFWRVSIWDERGIKQEIGTSWFETGLFGSTYGAQWIGSPRPSVNTDGLDTYRICLRLCAASEPVGIVICGRNHSNYVLVELDIAARRVFVREHSDNAWTTNVPSVTTLGSADGYPVSEQAIAARQGANLIEITVYHRYIQIALNSSIIAEGDILPADPVNQPRKAHLMLFGLKQPHGYAEYDSITIENSATNETYQSDHFDDDSGILSALGTVRDGALVVRQEFHLVNPVPPVCVRKSFTAAKPVKSARLYVSALGFYEAYLCGRKIGEDFYAPGFTDYRRRIYYQTYDVTDYIHQGRNSIGAIVTKGYYSGFVGYTAYPMVYGKQNAFFAVLALTYEDGNEKIIVTDPSWQFTDKSAVIHADYQQGEAYDARLAIDWDNETDNRWQPCAVIAAPQDALLEAQRGPSARIERILTPIAVWESPKGRFVYDFGQNMVGTVRLTIRGRRGLAVKLRYGEMCTKDGVIYIKNLRTAANTDTYICGSEEAEIFIPAFTAHGFRYLEVSGDSAEPNDCIVSVEGLVITNTTERTGSFSCSDENINQLQSNIEWGQRGNSLLVFTDCPQRNERMGWTGDAQIFAGTAAYNMDVRAFTDKWLTDLRDAQLLYDKGGAVPDTAPLGGDNRPDGCGGWGDAAVIVPWEMYRAYGDKHILEENYDMMKKWVAYQSRLDRQNCGLRTVNGAEAPERSDLSDRPFLQIQQRRGDHLAYDETTPFILSATAYAAYVSRLLSRIADILGHADDAKKYRQRFEDIRAAFCQAWVREDGSVAYWGEMSKSEKDAQGNVINNTYYSESSDGAFPSQTAYALAIDFELVPHETLSHTAECLQRAIARNGGKLSVGFLGISHLAPALTKAGCTDAAFALLCRTENPSWLYSVKNGATTIWERWNSYVAETDTFGNVNMNSFNHYAYGAIGQWLYRTIAGIDTGETPDEVGYRKIILRPTVGGGLMHAEGEHFSPYGRIISAWRIENGRFYYSCTVPPNTSANLYLLMDDVIQQPHEGVQFLCVESGRRIYMLQSGSYEFIQKYEQKGYRNGIL